MITQNTLFILGAGASCPYNYPSGKELRRRICLDFVDNYRNYIIDYQDGNDSVNDYINQLKDFTTRFLESSTKSIDLFLARNPRLVGFGKYAIALEILKAELDSNFSDTMDKPELDWYSYLYDKLTNTLLDKDDFEISKNNVSFITFNYDRSIEQFLFRSLFNSFEGIKEPDAASEIKKVPIIHIFGKVAPLPWEADLNTIAYKSEISDSNIQIACKNIRVIDEGLEDNVFVKSRELISVADKIFFLGFGYRPENMQILDFPKILRGGQLVFGTGLGFSKTEIDSCKEEFFFHGGTHSTNIYIEEKFDNVSLLKEYLNKNLIPD